MLSLYAWIGRDWNHDLAAFRGPAGSRGVLGQPFWSTLESSDGRDCNFGSIRWPRMQNPICDRNLRTHKEL